MKKFILFVDIILLCFALTPRAAAQNAQMVANGAPTAPINVPTDCTYTWVNDAPGIGLPASGTGTIPSFTAVNTGSTPITATITATPSPPMVYITSSSSGKISVINSATNTVVATIPGTTRPDDVVMSPDGSRFYVHTLLNIEVINTATNTIVSTIPDIPADGFFGMQVSPDGSKLYVVNINASIITVYNTASNAVLATLPVNPTPYGLALSPDGSLIYVASSDAIVYVIDATTYTVTATITAGGTFPNFLEISPDGSRLYEANQSSNSVSVINTGTNTVVANIPLSSTPFCEAISPDGSRLYVTIEGGNTVSVINTMTNMVISTITVGNNPVGISILHDGSRIYVVSLVDNAVTVVNTATNSIIATVPVIGFLVDIGHFISGSCDPTPLTYTITVNPSSSITSGPATGSITACAGHASTAPDIGQITVSGNALTTDITATASPGFQISLAPGSGYSSSLSLPQSGGTVTNTIIYIRSAASVPAGSPTGSINLSSTGVTTQDIPVSATVNSLPTVGFTPDTIFLTGTGIQLTPTTSGSISTYQWSPGYGLSSTDIQDPVADPRNSTTYRLSVTTDQGCTSAGEITVIPRLPLLIPNSFTPNGDGHNDIFRIPVGAPLLLQEFAVFNRMGMEVFDTKNIGEGWDGTYHGIPVRAGTYVYLIKGKSLTGNRIELEGTVILIR